MRKEEEGRLVDWHCILDQDEGKWKTDALLKINCDVRGLLKCTGRWQLDIGVYP